MVLLNITDSIATRLELIGDSLQKISSEKEFKRTISFPHVRKHFMMEYQGLYFEQIGEGNEWRVCTPEGKALETVTFNVMLQRQEQSQASESAAKQTPFNDCMKRIFEKYQTSILP